LFSHNFAHHLDAHRARRTANHLAGCIHVMGIQDPSFLTRRSHAPGHFDLADNFPAGCAGTLGTFAAFFK
jgi:hypothetical protein